MKVHYIACATSSSLDMGTNQLSLFHILDEIAGPAFPLYLPSFCVAALFEREPDDAVLQSFILAVSLETTLIASFTMGVDFTTARRTRSVNTVRGLTIPAVGTVTINILQKAKVLASWQAIAVQNGHPDAGPKAAAKPAAGIEPRAPGSKAALTVN